MSRELHYVLDGHGVRAVPLLAWARWFETADRRVAETFLEDGARVSTVFLGIDHNLWGQGPPLLFETMVFSPGDGDDLDCRRYSTWEQAAAGHAETVGRLRAERGAAVTGLRRAEALRWYTPFLQGRPFDRPTCIGVVARVNPDVPDWAAYIGPALGEDEQGDVLAIAEWGAKLEEDVARVYAAGKEYAAWPYRR